MQQLDHLLLEYTQFRMPKELDNSKQGEEIEVE